MPRAKRDKKISLTKTDRKGLQWKQQIVEDIRSCVQKYPNIYLFSVQNMRNNLLKDLRSEWKKDARFIFGKNRVMQLALGRSEEDEVDSDLHKLSKRLKGQCGLLFTVRDETDVLDWSKQYSALEYARSGFIATETVVLPEGPLDDFSHAIEPHLRSLGMPTKLDRGIVALYKEFTVCTEGKVLTPEQARILKLFAKPMATFTLEIKCSWSKDSGYRSYVAEEVSTDSGNAGDEEDVEMSDDD
ncbi:mRNA turnover protein 4 homolog [Contarinia nasturtii]|uniref:mRNA turnover protein 4 homolog n=1 Tax=Contarinia nasturtii TaxID=265458 RepID=UPI0012D4060C|nr:mRNA turnover protein 4 homolog [Contarinia nasturtii]